MLETWVRSLGWEDPLEKGKATHSSILAWRIRWTVRRQSRLPAEGGGRREGQAGGQAEVCLSRTFLAAGRAKDPEKPKQF